MRTPTSQNIAGVHRPKGCDLADVNNIILTIDLATAARKGRAMSGFKLGK